jgi:hypothetical protein
MSEGELGSVFLAAWLWVALVALVASMFALAISPTGTWTAFCAQCALIWARSVRWFASCGARLRGAQSILHSRTAVEDCFRPVLPCETAERPTLNGRPVLPNRRLVSQAVPGGVTGNPLTFEQWTEANRDRLQMEFERERSISEWLEDSSHGSAPEAPDKQPTPASYSSTCQAVTEVVLAERERFRKTACETARTEPDAPQNAAERPLRTDAPDSGDFPNASDACEDCARWAHKCEGLRNEVESTTRELRQYRAWLKNESEAHRLTGEEHDRHEATSRRRLRQLTAAREELKKAQAHAELDRHEIDQLNIEARELRDAELHLTREGWALCRAVEGFLDWFDSDCLHSAELREASRRWQDACPPLSPSDAPEVKS